jgi:anti-sigma factor RsiW
MNAARQAPSMNTTTTAPLLLGTARTAAWTLLFGGGLVLGGLVLGALALVCTRSLAKAGRVR